jgi:putative transposase
MVRQGLVARPPRRWRRTTDASHREPIAPNLLDRNFTAEAPDLIWVADTAYLSVIDGFLFLAVVLDLFSRKVVGWSLGDHLDAELSVEALRRAIARRRRQGCSSTPTAPRSSAPLRSGRSWRRSPPCRA